SYSPALPNWPKVEGARWLSLQSCQFFAVALLPSQPKVRIDAKSQLEEVGESLIYGHLAGQQIFDLSVFKHQLLTEFIFEVFQDGIAWWGEQFEFVVFIHKSSIFNVLGSRLPPHLPLHDFPAAGIVPLHELLVAVFAEDGIPFRRLGIREGIVKVRQCLFLGPAFGKDASTVVTSVFVGLQLFHGSKVKKALQTAQKSDFGLFKALPTPQPDVDSVHPARMLLQATCRRSPDSMSSPAQKVSSVEL